MMGKGEPTCIFHPGGDCRGCFTQRRKAESCGKVARLLQQLHGWQVSAYYVGDVQEAKNRHGGSWGLVPPACHGVTWAGFHSVFKNKSKPEEREEERSAFENLFPHFQWVSLSTYSLGHIVVNTIFLIIIVWGL